MGDKVWKCHSCHLPLEAYDSRGKWRCKQCLGVLVELHELGMELGELGMELGGDIDTSRLVETPATCPICDGGMNQLAIDGVIIERCPTDHAMWFDAGELGRIRRSIAGANASPVLVRVWTAYFSNLD